MTNYIKPECMPYYYDADGTKVTKRHSQSIAYTSDGYLLPCCWCDSTTTREDITYLNMYDEQLKLSNNETVEDIVNSEPWKNFIHIIMTEYDNAPRCCRHRCGVINE